MTREQIEFLLYEIMHQMLRTVTSYICHPYVYHHYCPLNYYYLIQICDVFSRSHSGLWGYFGIFRNPQYYLLNHCELSCDTDFGYMGIFTDHLKRDHLLSWKTEQKTHNHLFKNKCVKKTELSEGGPVIKPVDRNSWEFQLYHAGRTWINMYKHNLSAGILGDAKSPAIDH